ncbi:mannose-1-phosphate guanylyltransferase [Taibaiella koreensis]|uniref:mannose-1-phosphate guanylyltransferase n=1 Tax=Taibaiella koreensis TaxID=1268548 RepID=UPI000E59E1AC|nr:mannose-1-phosphate guanylyltransferase [Taibaiella koreensis]
MSIHNNYVAILAGGVGSRFWPESRLKLPKQFLDLLGTGQTLLQNTYNRFKDICPRENIYVVTFESYTDLVRQQLPGVPETNIVAEPSRKNTAPSAAYISHKIYARNPQANLILTPADHLITDERIFERQVFETLDFVSKNNHIASIGIRPTRPDTTYGYIQYEMGDGDDLFHKVKTFIEKPNLDIARTFLRSGDFLWNSGIFAWNVKTFISVLDEHLPELNDVFVQARDVLNTPKEAKAMEMLYAQCTNISIDYAIMEKVRTVYVLASRFGWSDLGTWESAYEHSEKDYLGNAVYGKNVMIIDASGSMVMAPDHKLVVLQGLEQYIVVDTPEVLLICERSKEHQIKDYLAEVKRNKGEKFL